MHANLRPDWASAADTDSYGQWADAIIAGLPHRFRWIPPGRFIMGSPVTELGRECGPWGKETQHVVTLTRGLWLAETPCTQELWQAVTGANPSEFKGPKKPVENVNFFDISRFFAILNAGGDTWRLPTEAEWEYACRAGTQTAFAFGDEISSRQARYDADVPYLGGVKNPRRQGTLEVASVERNRWGLFDMHGNVWEWCHDVYREDIGCDPAVDPLNDGVPWSAEPRVVRGGGWTCAAHGARCAFRSYDDPSDRLGNLGFRIARSAP